MRLVCVVFFALSAAGETLLSEDFSAGIPPNWTVVDGGDDGHTWAESTPGFQLFYSMLVEPAAIVDIELAGAAYLKESLITPPLDFTNAATATLTYSWVCASDSSLAIDVQIGNGEWTSLYSALWGALLSFDQSTVDCSLVAGHADVRFRFTYERPESSTNKGWFVAVDDVVIEIDALLPDAGEPNDDPAEAAPLEIGGLIEASLHSSEDQDFYSFRVDETATIAIRLVTPVGLAGFTLYDDQLNFIDYRDQFVNAGGFDGTMSVWLTPGEYFILVYGQYGLTLPEYHISLFERQPDPIAVGQTLSGSIVTADEVDLFTFSIEKPGYYQLITSGSEGDTQLLLRDESSHYIASDDDSGEGYFSSIIAWFEPGRYVAEVSNPGYEMPVENYQFTVAIAAPDLFEPDGNADTATSIGPGSTTSGHTLFPEADQDWFVFTLETNSVVNVEIRNSRDVTAALPISIRSESSAVARGQGLLVAALRPGSYYVIVAEDGAGDDIHDYTLLLRATPQSIPSYRFERMWPTLQQPWYFAYITDLANDSHGNIFVLDAEQPSVRQFTPNGVLATEVRLDGLYPDRFFFMDLDVDSFGNLYLLSELNEIFKLGPDGTIAAKWGGDGSNPGEFLFAADIAVDSLNNVYVVDSWNYRVQKFDGNGDYVLAWGSQGPGPGQFQDPEAIAIDPQGFIYVSDWNRVQKFTSNGDLIGDWPGVQLVAGDEFSQVVMSCDGQGNILIGDRNQSRVLRFSPTGTFQNQWDTFSPGGGGRFLGLNSLVASDQGTFVAMADGVTKYSPGGVNLNNWISYGSQGGSFVNPAAISISVSDDIYVADMRQIQRFSPDGRFVDQWPTDTGWPVAMAVNPDFGVSVLGCKATDSYEMLVYNSEGLLAHQWPLTAPEQHANAYAYYDVGVDGQGLIYVFGYYDAALAIGEPLIGKSWVQVFSPNGVRLSEWTAARQAGRTGWPEDHSPACYIDSHGQAYIPGYVGQDLHIRQFAPDGELLEDVVLGQAEEDLTDFTITNEFIIAVFTTGRVQIHALEGTLLASTGSYGVGAGQFSYDTDIAADSLGNIYVADFIYNRVQKIARADTFANAKAIIVAGGGGYAGNNLWDATQLCANFAYRALTHQGFTKDTIYYLSSDLDLDLDGNGQPDDVDADATMANLEHAISTWASDADTVVLYLVDHGGNDAFRISSGEVIPAATLASWLNRLSKQVVSPLVVVYDACQSGTFVDDLDGSNRIVIASSIEGESAYFLNTGTISFSNFFWTHVFNGLSVAGSFALASEAIGETIQFQTPQLRDPGNLAETTFIGNGTEIVGDRPRVLSVSSPGTIAEGVNSIELGSEVEDDDGVARVWAVVIPPNFASSDPDNPIQSLPEAELFPTENPGQWHGTFTGLSSPGTYQIAIYGQDRIGNTSLPKTALVIAGNPPRKRAIILGGGSQADSDWPAVEAGLRTAYEALTFQGYSADDILLYSPVTFRPEVDGLNTLSNLQYALTEWPGEDTGDVALYLMGGGERGRFLVNADEELTAQQLAAWLQVLEGQITGTAVVVYDANYAGSFLSEIVAPLGEPRVVIASAGADQFACQAVRSDVSFSTYFWRRILNGASVGSAFAHARTAMEFGARGQGAELDDNGDGVYDSKSDGVLARNLNLGTGVLLAGDDPVVNDVSEPQELTDSVTATLRAERVTTTSNIDSVFAVVVPPASAEKHGECVAVEVVELVPTGGGNYEGTYAGFIDHGVYGIAVIAADLGGGLSTPALTNVTQTQQITISQGDEYEDDDEPKRASLMLIDGSVQSHTIHAPGDEDWVRFYTIAQQIVSIRTENLGQRADTVIELYASDGSTLLASNDDAGPGDPSSLLHYSVTDAGVLFIRIRNVGSTVSGPDSSYDLRIFLEAGPIIYGMLVGSIVDQDNGSRVPEAIVTLQAMLGSNQYVQRTGFDGTYGFVNPGAGNYVLTVSAEGYEPTEHQVSLSNELSQLDVELSRAGTEGEGEGEGEPGPSCHGGGPGARGHTAFPYAFLLVVLAVRSGRCRRAARQTRTR